jgi:hypothetical protein
MADDYKLIPMSEITDEARKLAVAWMECDDKVLKDWIGQKHKLASDIMNYAKKYHEAQNTQGSQGAIRPMPTDYDIDNAAEDCYNDKTIVLTVGDKKLSRTELEKIIFLTGYRIGAKDALSGNIYISPKKDVRR